MLDRLQKNLRYAVRRLRARPGFTAIAMVSLALGIGANTAIFSLVNAILLRDVPLENPEELVEVYESTPNFEYGVFSYPDYEDFVEGTQEVFASVSATRLSLARAERGGTVEVLPTELVTGNYFDSLGIGAAVGRTIATEDDVAPGGHPVVMLGHGYWQQGFGGDPGVVGQTLRIAGRPFTIIGVVPKDYPGALRGVAPSIFAPRMMVDEIQAASGGSELEKRGNHGVFVKARLRPGVSLVQARASAEAVAARITEMAPENWDPQTSFLLYPTTDVVLMPPIDKFIRAAAWLLMTVVGLVLLIACINLASFLLARALDRRKEVALRLALGASRRDLVSQLMTETLLLSLLGGLGGAALGAGLLRILLTADLPLPLPITLDLGLDATVLSFTLLVSLAAGLLLGLVPAMQATRPDVAATIKDEAAGVGRSGTFTLRNALVVAQVATSVVLLVGAGLFLRSFSSIQTVDPGFGQEPSAVVTVGLPSRDISDEEGRLFFQRLEDSFRSLPGVTAVGSTNNLHLNTLNIQNMAINVDGVEPPPEREYHLVDRASASPGYFDAVGIRISRGRNFDERDRADSQQVAIINEALAEKFWGNRDPVGGMLRRPDEGDADLLVIGVASTAKIRTLGEAPRPFVYRPLSQEYGSFQTLVARTTIDPERTATDMVVAAQTLDDDLLIWEAKTMERHLAIVKLPQRLSALILTGFAVLALLLASIGLYGIVSYAVAQRSREVGIRISLGADGASVIKMLMGGGMKLVAMGGIAGLILSLLLAPALASLLFGVQPMDGVTFLVMPLVLGVVATLAAYIPARRASRIDPVRALRFE